MKNLLYPLIGAIVLGLFWTGLIAFAAWGFEPSGWESIGRFAYAVTLIGVVFCGAVIGADAADD